MSDVCAEVGNTVGSSFGAYDGAYDVGCIVGCTVGTYACTPKFDSHTRKIFATPSLLSPEMSTLLKLVDTEITLSNPIKATEFVVDKPYLEQAPTK